MDLGLKGRVAIVTGGSRGLGRAEAEALAAEGATVVVATARSIGEAEAVARGLRERGPAASLQADVSQTADVQRLVGTTLKTFGRLVAFLASEAASYVNGAVVDLGGGRLEYVM